MKRPEIHALVFDAYGTIFDVYSVLATCEQHFPGGGKELSQLWRTKQLEYSWLRSLMGRYRDFEGVTEDALDFAVRALKLELTPSARAALMQAYLRLTPYPDVPPALARLAFMPCAILSNGSPRMLEAAVDNAGLRAHFGAVLSVDQVGIYKPSPKVYELAPQRLGVPKQAIGFVSSNGWDAAGASAFGFTTFWINRGGQPIEALGCEPHRVVGSLGEVADWVLAHGAN